MILTASNCQQQKSSTLLVAYDQMARFESDDIARELEVIEIETAVSRELERRGFEYSDDDNEWTIPAING